MPSLNSIHGVDTTLILNPDLCTLCTCDLTLANLTYLPSIWDSTIFSSLFSILLSFQLCLGLKHKTWGFLISMLLGVSMMSHLSKIT
jgi:hypothetical protein